MSVKFFNMTRAEFLSKKLLHKYMPLERVLEMLTNQTIWFANPTIWKDPFEKRFIENVYNIGGVQKPFPWKDRVYCMCATQTAPARLIGMPILQERLVYQSSLIDRIC